MTRVSAWRICYWVFISLLGLRGPMYGKLVKVMVLARMCQGNIDGFRHSDKVVFRLANVLDTLTDKGVLSRDQTAAIVAALHRADWDGLSIDRLGRILAAPARHGGISAAPRDAIMDGMRP